MESSITNESERLDAMKMAFYEGAYTSYEKAQEQEELSCNQLLKNLIKTNLRLLKMNDINFIMF